MKRYFTIINLALITVAIYLGVDAFYNVATERLTPGPVSRTENQTAPASDDDTRHPLAHYNVITERDLFQTKGSEGQAPKKVDIDSLDKLKPTELKLKLHGTVSGDDAKAYAVIEDPKKRQQNLYRQGDSIQKAIVKLVLREKVVLTVDGKDEILEMEKRSSKGKSSSRRPSGDKGPAGSARSSQKITLQRAQLDDAVADVNKLMQQVKIRPHFKNGQPDGLSLTRIKPGSIFQKMGLKSGDIIVGLDGEEIESVDDAMEVYNKLKSASGAKLEIKRRGRSKTLDYSVE